MQTATSEVTTPAHRASTGGHGAANRCAFCAAPSTAIFAIYAGQAPHERVAVLLALLGGHQRVTLPKDYIEPQL
jgi:hypothetical protein